MLLLLAARPVLAQLSFFKRTATETPHSYGAPPSEAWRHHPSSGVASSQKHTAQSRASVTPIKGELIRKLTGGQDPFEWTNETDMQPPFFGSSLAMSVLGPAVVNIASTIVRAQHSSNPQNVTPACYGLITACTRRR